MGRCVKKEVEFYYPASKRIAHTHTRRREKKSVSARVCTSFQPNNTAASYIQQKPKVICCIQVNVSCDVLEQQSLERGENISAGEW